MREIPITRGLIVIVDDDDYHELAKYRWCASYSSSGYYACRGIWSKKEKKCEYVYMHRLLANAKKGEQVDHINGNRLDNRRCNLRICSRHENQRNMKARASGTKGIHFVKRRIHLKTPWSAYIRIDGRRKHLGYFASSDEAQLAYNAAAVVHYGEFARLPEARA